MAEEEALPGDEEEEEERAAGCLVPYTRITPHGRRVVGNLQPPGRGCGGVLPFAIHSRSGGECRETHAQNQRRVRAVGTCPDKPYMHLLKSLACSGIQI